MVYFVCRSEYESPHGRRIVEYPDAANLADWFRTHWITREEQIDDFPKNVFGGDVYGLYDFLTPMLNRSAPESLADVEDFIASFEGNYFYGAIEMIDGAIQAWTNDDEIDIAWYLFDDRFVKQFPERVSFLINRQLALPEESHHEGWIPPIETKMIAEGDETTFCCFFSGQPTSSILEIEGCYRVPARLPELGAWLCGQSIESSREEDEAVKTDWLSVLILLRALALVRKNQSFEEVLRSFDALNSELTGWLPDTFSDYRYKAEDPLFLTTEPTVITEQIRAFHNATPKSGEKTRSSCYVYTSGVTFFQFAPRMCQVVFTEILTDHDDPSGSTKFFRHWIFFDDLWASAHRPLAESILRYGRGENVLGV